MRRGIKAVAAVLAAAVVVSWSAGSGRAQDTALVLRGGTLIDATGKPPIQNSVIVITGNRITAVGSGDSVQVPAGARIIDAAQPLSQVVATLKSELWSTL